LPGEWGQRSSTIEALQGGIVSLPSLITIIATRDKNGEIIPAIQGGARLVVEGVINLQDPYL
jgi:hypothetical protein